MVVGIEAEDIEEGDKILVPMRVVRVVRHDNTIEFVLVDADMDSPPPVCVKVISVHHKQEMDVKKP